MVQFDKGHAVSSYKLEAILFLFRQFVQYQVLDVASALYSGRENISNSLPGVRSIATDETLAFSG